MLLKCHIIELRNMKRLIMFLSIALVAVFSCNKETNTDVVLYPDENGGYSINGHSYNPFIENSGLQGYCIVHNCMDFPVILSIGTKTVPETLYTLDSGDNVYLAYVIDGSGDSFLQPGVISVSVDFGSHGILTYSIRSGKGITENHPGWFNYFIHSHSSIFDDYEIMSEVYPLDGKTYRFAKKIQNYTYPIGQKLIEFLSK